MDLVRSYLKRHHMPIPSYKDTFKYTISVSTNTTWVENPSPPPLHKKPVELVSAYLRLRAIEEMKSKRMFLAC
jgi:hypothetical protein